jgi:hypothetical protein
MSDGKPRAGRIYVLVLPAILSRSRSLRPPRIADNIPRLRLCCTVCTHRRQSGDRSLRHRLRRGVLAPQFTGHGGQEMGLRLLVAPLPGGGVLPLDASASTTNTWSPC